jgi:CheY-like chemotaxis protein/multisubunit Na+/H+ antiporter MnhB subunit
VPVSLARLLPDEPPLEGGADPIRVVIVEDDEDYREIVGDELSWHGFVVRSFADGASLLGSLDITDDADLIVLDWRLPNISGIDLLPELRRHGVDLPVVFLTSHAQLANEKLAFERGALDFIDKTRGVAFLAKRLRLVSKHCKPAANPKADKPKVDKPIVYGKRVLRNFDKVPGMSAESIDWYYGDRGQIVGPLSFEGVVARINQAGIEKHLVWTQGMLQWAEAKTVPAFTDLFRTRPPALPSSLLFEGESRMRLAGAAAPPPVLSAPPVLRQDSQKKAQSPGASRSQHEHAPAWRRRILRHPGSTVAVVFGVLAFFGAMGGVGSGDHAFEGLLTAGSVLILGALAYRSAKQRRLGEVASTPLRRVGEGIAILLLLLSVLLQKDLKNQIVTEPLATVLIPVWALVAYLLVALWPRRFTRSVPCPDRDGS